VHNAMRFGLILSVYGVSFIKLDMEYSCVYVEGVEETDGFQNESDMSQAKDKHQNYVHQKLPPVACVPTPSDPPPKPYSSSRTEPYKKAMASSDHWPAVYTDIWQLLTIASLDQSVPQVGYLEPSKVFVAWVPFRQVNVIYASLSLPGLTLLHP
jgi:hypothetical protein